ncbi:MAG: hypothetical protein JRH20_11470 [Deltaproteobacteria bacterium]|nr:hypothetical protein [Deltaproteobacteria bacterium]
MVRFRFLFLAVPIFAVACATGKPQLTPVREVARASGSPQILRVVDLGELTLPRSGEVSTKDSDGRFVVGELLLVYGDNFGKQPALALGGEPCDVLSHVTGGGVVVRVPRGVPAGSVVLEVSTRRGRTQKKLKVDRRGLVSTGAAVQRFSLALDGVPTLGATLELPKVKQLLPSKDGAVAFAITGGKLAIQSVEMIGPLRVVGSDDLPGKQLQTAAASRSGRLAIVTDSHLVVVDAQRSRQPSFYKPLALPRALLDKRMESAALSPDGRTLAVLLMASNQLLLLDLRDPRTLPQPELREILSEAKLPRVRALRFARDGRTLWAVAGDTAGSINAGHQVAEVLAFTVVEGAVVGEPKRVVLREGFVPVAVAVGAGDPTPAGTAIRAQVARSSLYLTAGSAALMSKASPSAEGLVFRVSGGKVTTLLPGKWSPVAVAVAGRPNVLVALAARGSKRELVLITRAAWARDVKPQVTSLKGTLQLHELFSPSSLVLQP